MLFELDGVSLREIFAERVDQLSVDRAAVRQQEEHARVMLQTTQHRGHFHLLLRSSKQVTELGGDPTVAVRDGRKPEHSVQSRRFVWNGTRYEEAQQ